MTKSAEQIVSLPKGGGAQHGLGESFTPDLHTGTGNAAIPIHVPSGRGDFRPQLSLRYGSGGGNGPFGLGWEISIPTVTRTTSRGVPRYGAEDTFLLAGVEELVPVPGAPAGAQRYRPRTEGLFSLIDHHGAGSDHWEVRARNGATNIYGTPRPATAGPGWSDPAVVADPQLRGRRNFAWRLTESRDSLGNRIVYRYRRDSDVDGPHRWDQLYLRDVRYVDYGPISTPTYAVSVQFIYDDEPDPLDGSAQPARPDPFSEYRSGFEIRTRRRCTCIVVSTHTDSDRRVRAYQLVYLDTRTDLTDLAERLPLNRLSLLSQVEMIGFDDAGAAVREVPPVELDYTVFEPRRRRFAPLTGRDLPSSSLADPSLELVDLTGDGLPDLFEANGTVRYWRNTGYGSFEPARAMGEAPGLARLAAPGVALLDANGDGRPDLVTTDGTTPGFFPVRPDATFDRRSFQPYTTAPTFSLEDPDVRLVDIDGDGVTDAVRSGSRLECFFNDARRGWTPRAVRQVERRSIDQFPNVDFSDVRVRFGDMTGDGQQDVVLLYDGNVEYWPNLGRGNFAPRIHMRNSPRFPYGYDPRRVLLGDVDGDGLADVLLVDDGRVTLWVNRAGNEWSEPIEIAGTPPVSDTAAVRLADVHGTGVTGVLWSSEPRGQPPESLYFLDLVGGSKPYLLSAMDNGIGASTRMAYAPSTHFYREDRRRLRTRWRSTLPFPVHVVASVEVIDGVSGLKLTTEFSYHHGYWDGFEREFRGFGCVHRLDTQTSVDYNSPGLHGDVAFATVDGSRAPHFSPPLLIKTWFHQGPVAEASGEWRENDFGDEFWPTDRQVLERPDATKQVLASLPRSARRDALRSMRGNILRTELYALDGTVRATAPYTVTERVAGLREVAPPGAGESGRRRIFFPHLVAQRTTQWERGDDPLTRIELSLDYDDAGLPRCQTKIALPRRSAKRRAGGSAGGGDEDRVLASQTRTEYAVPDAGLHVRDRVAHVRTFVLDAPPSVVETDPDDLSAILLDQAATTSAVEDRFATLLDPWIAGDPLPDGIEFVGHEVTHYDGGPARAFLGRDPGEVGPYGVAVRTESLAFTSEILDAAWEAQRPAYLGGTRPLTAGAPNGFGADLGYRLRQRSVDGYHDGYYLDRERLKLDFHIAGTSAPRGLVLAVRDALGHGFAFEHDAYGLLPTSLTDGANLTTEVEHDYRAMQPKLLTDPNGNRSRFTYTALGLLRTVKLEGKAGVGDGDLVRPSQEFEYDFQTTPIAVRTRRYVHHDAETGLSAERLAAAIEHVEYSDGFGRLVQVRTRAEDVIFDAPGRPLFGDGRLSTDPDAVVGAAVGRRRSSGAPPNVVVSGARVLDNKGRAVEDYEPFFSTGFGYAAASGEEFGRRTTYEYDPRGTLVRTTFADGSAQTAVAGAPADPTLPDLVEPSPWQLTVYDPNDNAGRTTGADSHGSEYEHHWNTPTTFSLDALGRTLSVVERTRPAWDPGDPPTAIRELRSWTMFDARGNAVRVVDALGRAVLTSMFDLLDRPLRAETLDGGTRLSMFDAFGNVVEHVSERGGLVLRTFDALNRMSAVWARDDATSELGLREWFEHGDGGSPAQPAAERAAARAANTLGQLTRVYDQAGLVEFSAYDFKGNMLEKSRQVISDDELLAVFGPPAPTGWNVAGYSLDWRTAGSATLDPIRFELSFAYDALNRVTGIRYPTSTGTGRKTLTSAFDAGGLLTAVELDGAPFVTRIAYNARGRRTLIAYPGFMTRYAYEPVSGRLTRLRTEPYTSSDAGRTLTPAGPAPQDHLLRYDLAGNVVALVDRTPSAGVPGSAVGADELQRVFSYDPLYRLLAATGRQAPAVAAPWPADRRDVDAAATSAYTERFAYDDACNVVDLRRESITAGLRRTFTLVPGSNRLASATEGTSSRAYVYDGNGNVAAESDDRHFEWDHADRLRSFRVQQGTAAPSPFAHYLYDSTGRLVKKLVWRGPSEYETTAYVDGLFEHRSRTDTGAVTEHDLLHVMDDRRRIAIVRVGSEFDGSTAAPVVFHLGDHLGSANVTCEPSGAVVAREEWFAYGETSFGGSLGNRYRFTGVERDEESGLAYHGNRWYAPWLARWMSCDPLPPTRPSQACNQYAYVRGNPLSFVDPSGLQEDLPDDLVGGEPGRNGPVPREEPPPAPPLPPGLTAEQRKAFLDRWRSLGVQREWTNRDPISGKPVPPRSMTTHDEKIIFMIGDIARDVLILVVTLPAFWEWMAFRIAAATPAPVGAAVATGEVAYSAQRYYVGNTPSPELAQTLEALQAEGVSLRGNFVHVGEDSQMIGMVRQKGGALHELAGTDKGTTWINMDILKENIAAGRIAPLSTVKQVLQHEMGHFGQAVIRSEANSQIAYYLREADASMSAAKQATNVCDRAALSAHADANFNAAGSLWQ